MFWINLLETNVLDQPSPASSELKFNVRRINNNRSPESGSEDKSAETQSTVLIDGNLLSPGRWRQPGWVDSVNFAQAS